MPAQSLTETYTGSVVDWYVPNHTAGTLRVTCRGADGARAAGTPNGGGGYGGSVRGYLSVAPGTLLKLVVGAHGSNLSPPSFMAKGGFPHGLTTVARGGCATEVWDASSARIMVAGGGGSGAYGSSGGSGGGYRGGLGIANGEGESSGVYSFGGTTSAHGAAGANAGGGGTAATAGSSAGGGYTLSTGFGGGGGSSWCDTGLFSTVDNVGTTNGTARIVIEWDGDPVWYGSLPNCSTVTFAPGSTIGSGGDQPAVYSSSASLDTGFGTNRTPAGWPATGALIKAVEVELTATSPDFTANGQVQVGVFRPNDLLTLPGATTDASASFSGWTGGVGQYRSGFADCFYLDKFGGWVTDYLTHAASAATANSVTVGIIPAFGQNWDIRFSVRRSNWSTSSANTVCGTSTTPLIRCDSGGLYVYLGTASGSPYNFTVPWATLGAVNGAWLTARVTFDATNRCRVWIWSGGAWVLVYTAAVTGYSETPTRWGAWYVRTGNGQNASGISQQGLNGDMRSFSIRNAGTLIMDLGLDRMTTSATTSWSTTGGTAFRDAWLPVTGSTVPDTKRVRIDLEAPCAPDDFRLIVDAQTGGLTVDEILLEAACFGGIYVDGAVHF